MAVFRCSRIVKHLFPLSALLHQTEGRTPYTSASFPLPPCPQVLRILLIPPVPDPPGTTHRTTPWEQTLPAPGSRPARGWPPRFTGCRGSSFARHACGRERVPQAATRKCCLLSFANSRPLGKAGAMYFPLMQQQHRAHACLRVASW